MGKQIPLIVWIILLLAGCSRTVHVPVMSPSHFMAGQHIQTVAIIDRTDPENEVLHTIKGLLSGQLPSFQEEAVNSTLNGLVNSLNASPRFQVVQTGEKLKSNALFGQWPEPLDWGTIADLCAQYECDAIIALESFSSNFVVTQGTRTEGESDKKVYYANGVAGLKMGFRFYDLKNQSISDAAMYDRNAEWEASGSTILDAIRLLSDNHRQVLDNSYQIGVNYGNRIAPQWTRVNRTFYTKGRGTDFDIGVRMATVNDWEGAREAWQQSVHSPHRRTAGRSAYNLALMYEIKGDLEEARKWAQISYVDYRIRKGRSYVSTLDRRIRERNILEAVQMY